MSMQQTSTFSNLPTDIIFKLLDLLEPRETLQLAAVCRELAAIVSHIYYAHAGFSKLQERYFIKSDCRGYMDDLTGLSLDLRLRSIPHFVFHSSIFPEEVNVLARNMDRLCNIFGRISSVRSLCIKIQSRKNSGWNLQSTSVQRFTVNFQQLLEIVLRKGCTSLHIQLSHPVTTNYKFEIVNSNSTLRSFRSVAKDVRPPEIHGKGWKFTKTYDSNIPMSFTPPPGISSVRLTHIDFFTDFLLIPPHSLWTFVMLKSSPIVSLTLSLPQHTKVDVFQHYIFPNMVESLPLLQRLNFAFHGPSFMSSLAKNLPRLPHLQKLILGQTYYGPFEHDPENDLNGICKVTSLTGSLDQIIYLLGSIRFPALVFVNVLIEFRFSLEAHFVETGSQFMTIHRVLSWLNVKPRLSVRLLHQGSILTDIPLQAVKLQYVNHRSPTWITHFGYVTHLYLEVAMACQDTELSSTKDQVHYASQYALSWLNIFRCVTNLKLICRQPFLHSSSQFLKDQWTTIISNEIEGKHRIVQTLDVLYISKCSLRHWTCDDDDWGFGDSPMSERNVECHFNPGTYNRSLKPDWVMHDE